MDPLLRNATLDDLSQLARIYNQGIAARTATFETEPRQPGDIESWLDGSQILVVAETGGRVAGFARTSPYRDRVCYAGIREFAVYVDEDAKRLGLGQAVMRHLIEKARDAGLTKLIARIFKENTGSLALCDALGFRRVGTYLKHGQLDGQWRDCVIVELLLVDAA